MFQFSFRFAFYQLFVDPYNFELYRFKVGAFFETPCTFYLHDIVHGTV